MDTQAQTVTSITSAVDETALAAHSMSHTITNVRTEIERVASEIDAVESGVGNVDDQINRLNVVAREFRSEEHTSELQSLMRISYAVFCLKKKKTQTNQH